MKMKHIKEMEYKTEHETEVLYEGKYKKHNFIIMSYGTHPCGYVEIEKGSKFYLLDISCFDFIDCHGGITYCGNLNHALKKETNRWFIGWDYAHAGDYMGYDALFSRSKYNHKKWTTKEIYEEIKNVIEQLDKKEVLL